mgnify:CR=1 FL=1
MPRPKQNRRTISFRPATYDAAARVQRVYRDGELVGTRSQAAPFSGEGVLVLGCYIDGMFPFTGSETRPRGLFLFQKKQMRQLQ